MAVVGVAAVVVVVVTFSAATGIGVCDSSGSVAVPDPSRVVAAEAVAVAAVAVAEESVEEAPPAVDADGEKVGPEGVVPLTAWRRRRCIDCMSASAARSVQSPSSLLNTQCPCAWQAASGHANSAQSAATK